MMEPSTTRSCLTPVRPASPRIRFRTLNSREDNKTMEETGEEFNGGHGRSRPKGGRPKGPKRRGVSRYSHLLKENPAFNAWYRNIPRGSYNTCAWYLLRMGMLCDDLTKTTPVQIPTMNRAELMGYVSG